MGLTSHMQKRQRGLASSSFHPHTPNQAKALGDSTTALGTETKNALFQLKILHRGLMVDETSIGRKSGNSASILYQVQAVLPRFWEVNIFESIGKVTAYNPNPKHAGVMPWQWVFAPRVGRLPEFCLQYSLEYEQILNPQSRELHAYVGSCCDRIRISQMSNLLESPDVILSPVAQQRRYTMR